MHIYWIMEPFFAFFKTMFWVIFVLLKLFLKLFYYLHASYLYAFFHKQFLQYNFYILHRLFCIDKNISLSFISSSTQCSPSSLPSHPILGSPSALLNSLPLIVTLTPYICISLSWLYRVSRSSSNSRIGRSLHTLIPFLPQCLKNLIAYSDYQRPMYQHTLLFGDLLYCIIQMFQTFRNIQIYFSSAVLPKPTYEQFGVILGIRIRIFIYPFRHAHILLHAVYLKPSNKQLQDLRRE